MTAEQTELGRTLVAILRAEARGAARARPIDQLVVDLQARGFEVGRRDVERSLAAMAHAGLPLGATCNRAAECMGVFWFQAESDARLALANIDQRFRPLSIRRRHCLDWIARLRRAGRITDGTGAVEIDVGEDGRLRRMETDPGGQGRLFNAAGQSAAR